MATRRRERKREARKREGEEERTNRELVDQRERRAARNIEGRRLVSIMSARSDGEKTAGERMRAEVVEAEDGIS